MHMYIIVLATLPANGLTIDNIDIRNGYVVYIIYGLT